MEKFVNNECCPKFDPGPWDNKEFEWKDKLFVRTSVCTFFYMPLNFGGVMKKLDKAVSAAGADWSEGICLSDHTSKWNMDLYVAADKPVPSLGQKLFSGRFYSRVYEGPFKDTGRRAAPLQRLLVHLLAPAVDPVAQEAEQEQGEQHPRQRVLVELQPDAATADRPRA